MVMQNVHFDYQMQTTFFLTVFKGGFSPCFILWQVLIAFQ